jgi:hypothetical protein
MAEKSISLKKKDAQRRATNKAKKAAQDKKDEKVSKIGDKRQKIAQRHRLIALKFAYDHARRCSHGRG